VLLTRCRHQFSNNTAKSATRLRARPLKITLRGRLATANQPGRQHPRSQYLVANDLWRIGDDTPFRATLSTARKYSVGVFSQSDEGRTVKCRTTDLI
jgi:hypothetical protein